MNNSPQGLWVEAGDQLEGYFSVQVSNEGGSQGSEEWLDSGQIVTAETTGFADGLGAEREGGDSQRGLQSFGLSPGCCGPRESRGGQVGSGTHRTGQVCLVYLATKWATKWRRLSGRFSGAGTERSGLKLEIGEPSAWRWN